MVILISTGHIVVAWRVACALERAEREEDMK